MESPEKGFYYHYKHNPMGSVGNYAYEVLNIAYHTEIKETEGAEKSALVIYKPLYDALAYRSGKHWYARPLTMFMETIEKEGKTMPRFTKITDPEVISQLEKIKIEMYGKDN